MPQRIPRYVADHTGGAFILLTCAAAFAYLVLGIGYVKQSHKTQRLARESIKLSLEIQQQRRITIYQTCRAQNKKHVDLINFLRDEKVTPEMNPGAYVFVDKLAPLQDCREVVKKATSTP